MSHAAATSLPPRGAPGDIHRRERIPGLSVIICAFNSAGRLPQTLAALKTQVPPPDGWELIVVDNASTDATARVCEENWNQAGVPLRIIREDRPGLSHARHAGIKASRRAAFCLVDDDNHLVPEYLAIARELLAQHPDVAIVGGRGSALTEGARPDWLWQGWQSHAVGPQGREEGYVDPARGFVYGAGMVIRGQAWDELVAAGFTSLLTDRKGQSLSSGGDVELCLALRVLGWKIYYSPRLQFGHLMPAGRLTWAYCLRLFAAYGEANAVLELYQPWLTAGKKAVMKRTLVGTLLFQLLEWRRLKVRLSGSPPTGEGSTDALRWEETKGKKEAIARHLRSGRLFGFHRQIRRLARRAHRPQTP